MDSPLLLQTACALFVLPALGGLAMAGIRFSGQRNPPVWLAMAHGGLAVAGVALLAFAVLATAVPTAAVWSLILFLVAAAGGTVLFLSYEWKRELLPTWLVLVHALVAVVAFLLLVVAVFA
jgi:hypothetical protein